MLAAARSAYSMLFACIHHTFYFIDIGASKDTSVDTYVHNHRVSTYNISSRDSNDNQFKHYSNTAKRTQIESKCRQFMNLSHLIDLFVVLLLLLQNSGLVCQLQCRAEHRQQIDIHVRIYIHNTDGQTDINAFTYAQTLRNFTFIQTYISMHTYKHHKRHACRLTSTQTSDVQNFKFISRRATCSR